MANPNDPVRVETIDWQRILPFTQIFNSYRTAVHPSHLLVALVLVVLLYLLGWVLDAVWGPRVYPLEIEKYQTSTVDEFNVWRDGREEDARRSLKVRASFLPHVDDLIEGDDRFDQVIEAVSEHFNTTITALRNAKDDYEPAAFEAELTRRLEHRRRVIEQIRTLRPQGVFESALHYKLAAFERLITAATSLRFGFDEVLTDSPQRRDTVVAAMRDLLVTLPGWMYQTHKLFLVIYLAAGMALMALLGGAVARMSAVYATGRDRLAPTAAINFARQRWVWFFTAPLLPVVLAILINLCMAVGGLAFFNAPVLDLIGALIFGLALLAGFLLAMLFIGLVASFTLLYPAVAVDGADAFDAVSRAFGYVLRRPWRMIFYQIVALVYGAITYLFLSAVVFLTLRFTHDAVNQWVFSSIEQGAASRFEAMMPKPVIGKLSYEVDWSSLSVTGKIAAALIKVWVFAVIGLLGAYAISFYFSAQTWIYLLLRRAADGTEVDDLYEVEDLGASPPLVPDKTEPPAQT